jgi:hypothetical protein
VVFLTLPPSRVNLIDIADGELSYCSCSVIGRQNALSRHFSFHNIVGGLSEWGEFSPSSRSDRFSDITSFFESGLIIVGRFIDRRHTIRVDALERGRLDIGRHDRLKNAAPSIVVFATGDGLCVAADGIRYGDAHLPPHHAYRITALPA